MPAFRIDDNRVSIPGDKLGWPHVPWGMDGGKFGKVVNLAIVDKKGNFLFNKPVIEEGPHVITITFGWDSVDQCLKMALVKEQRDTAAELDGVDAPAFWGPPRGYAELTDSGLIAAGRREAGEETGANILAGDPWVITKDTVPNETIVRSRSPWVAIPVDLNKLSEIRPDQNEKIFSTDFFSVHELEVMISDGEYNGASTLSWCLMSAVLLFSIHILPYVDKWEDQFTP